MRDFTFHVPTKVVFGKGTEAQTGALCRECGATRVLVHFGGGSAQKSGLLERVYASLQAAGIPYVTLGGVRPNPHLALVREGIALCRAQGVDFLLPVGGGSVIDSAKAIGYGVANEGDVWDYYTGARTPEKCLPLGCVLTIAAAGSETSNSSVITNDETCEKRGVNAEICRCRFAVMNPELTMTLPAYQTACGVTDILMHTLERYFTAEKTPMTITDSLAEALLRDVMRNGRLLCREPGNYEARANIMWAGSISHNGLLHCGATNGDWAVHQFGIELSGKYDLAHGASLSAMWGSWARYVYQAAPGRFARLAVNVLEVPEEGSDEELALAGIEEMENFFWAIEMPTSIAEAGIDAGEEDIRQMVLGFTRHGAREVGDIRRLNAGDAAAVYRLARG